MAKCWFVSSVLSINIEQLSEFKKQDITFWTIHDEFDGTIQSVQIVKKTFDFLR